MDNIVFFYIQLINHHIYVVFFCLPYLKTVMDHKPLRVHNFYVY